MIADIRAALPELPVAKKARFIADYALPEYDAGVLVAERELADYFEAVLKPLTIKPNKPPTGSWVNY
jgi:aspartyl-tRNA(Asn)/glutamyl-tRNA(Gln) amidotransferase subunit B